MKYLVPDDWKTKERLRREILAWIERSLHESRVAFLAGDHWGGLVWGAKVPVLQDVLAILDAEPYETGPNINLRAFRVWQTIRQIDPDSRVQRMLAGSLRERVVPVSVECEFRVGMDPGVDRGSTMQMVMKKTREFINANAIYASAVNEPSRRYGLNLEKLKPVDEIKLEAFRAHSRLSPEEVVKRREEEFRNAMREKVKKAVRENLDRRSEEKSAQAIKALDERAGELFDEKYRVR